MVKRRTPKPSIRSLNKTNTCDGYGFNIDIINDDEYNALQKELLMLFEGYCIFGFGEFYKILLCILVEVNKTMYGNNEYVPTMFLDNLYPESHLGDVTFAVVWNVFAADENKSVNQPSMNLPLCAWNNMLGSMQYQVRCMLGDLSILRIARATS